MESRPGRVITAGPAPGPFYDAAELPAGEVSSGALAFEAGSDVGETNLLPSGPAFTASCSALPCRYCWKVMNHSVQPLSHLPPFGLPMTVIGSPGTAIW